MAMYWDPGMDEAFYYSEKNAAEDPDWAFLSSYKLNTSLRQQEPQSKEEPQTAPLDKYLSLVEFDPAAFKAIKQHSVSAWKTKANRMAQSVRAELAGYYGRVASTYYKILTDAAYAKFQPLPRAEIKEFPEGLRDLSTRPFVFDTLPGSEPSTSWPYSLPELVIRLKTMHPASLWLEPFDLDYSFQEKAIHFLMTTQDEQQAVEALQVLFLLSFLSGSGTRLCRALHELWRYSRTHTLSPSAIDTLKTAIQPHIDFLHDLIQRERSLHYVRISSILGRFSVAHHSMFQKNQTGWNTSITTDGEYLYLFVGCQNGGMFKIGTGEQGTISGKVYLFAALDRPEDGAWVYCKGKLYLRSSSRETGLICVICPHTFKHEGLLQLYSPELFGSPAQLALNKNFPFLTDKDHLYVVGMKISPAPVPNPSPNQKPPEATEEEKKEKREENKKKKREEEKKEPKLCEFLLVKFDVGQLQSSNKAFETEPDELTKEIYSGFAGYFSFTECQRALSISQNDIQSAVQWLVENGDNERGKKIVMPLASTLLCQADVLSMGTGKMMKPEVSVKGDSVLTPEAVTRSVWTTDGKEVTVYTVNPDGASATAKIFSTNPEAVKELEPDAHVLPNTPHQITTDSSLLFDPKDLFAPLKPERKDLPQRPYPLKGTHLTNRECEKYAILESVCCFDPFSHRFYSCLLNWTYGVYFNVFADLPQYGAAISGLLTRKSTEVPMDSLDALICDLMEIIENCEGKKFDLPWKWRCWTTLYRNSIMRHNKLLRATSEEDQSKKLTKIIEKLYKRVERMYKFESKLLLKQLNLTPIPQEKKKKPGNSEKKPDLFSGKRTSEVFVLKETGKVKSDAMVLACDTPQVTLEDGKDTIMSVEGGEIGLETLLNWAIDAKNSNSVLFPTLLTHILLWIIHAGSLVPSKTTVSRVVSLLEELLTKEKDENIKDLTWKILIHGWKMWCSDSISQIKWLIAIFQASNLLKNPIILGRKDSFLTLIKSEHVNLSYNTIFKSNVSPLICWFLRFCSGPQSILQEIGYFTGFTHVFSVLVDKQSEENSLKNANKVVFEYDESVIGEKKPYFGKILVADGREEGEGKIAAREELWKCMEMALMQTVEEPASPETPAIFSIFCFLTKAAHTELSDISDLTLQKSLQTSLVLRMLGVLHRTLEVFYSVEGGRTSSLHAKWLGYMKNALLMASHFADKAAGLECPSSELVNQVISLIHAIKRLFSTSEGEVLSVLHQNYSVGADSTYERTFETTHPYQRGKQQINENLTFPGALAVYVELDPRSQSDNHVDYLLVSSLETTPGHLNNYSGEVLAPYFKLSGKLNFTGPLVLQGSSLHIEFNASSQAREESSSNRWGFKLKVKPVFGEPLLHLSDSSKTSLYNRLAMRFGGETQLAQWVQLLNGMSFGVSSMVQRLTEKSRRDDCSILKWHLFSGGLSSNPYDECIKVTEEWMELQDIPVPKVTSSAVSTWEELVVTLPGEIQKHIQEIVTGESPIHRIETHMREIVPAPMNYRAEKLRPSFSKELQELWRMAEAVTLYTLLHHTSQFSTLSDWVTTPEHQPLVHDERYVTEQLKACAKKVNEVIAWMLARLQSEREKQMVMMDVWEEKERRLKTKREEIKASLEAENNKEEEKIAIKKVPEEVKLTRKLEVKAGSKKVKSKRLFMSKAPKKVKKKEEIEVIPVPEPVIELTSADKSIILSHFLENFIGNDDRTREICNRFNVSPSTPNESLKAIFEICYNSEKEQGRSPYWIVGNHVIMRLMVLLKFRPNPVGQLGEEGEGSMDAPVLTRAASTATQESAQKIEAMRNWVDSYKKWKQWQLPSQPEEDLTSPLASPLKAIVKFTCADFDWSLLEQEAMLQTHLAGKRVMGLQLMNRLYQALQDSPASKMCLNLLPTESVFSGVECCGQVLANHLNTQAGRIFRELMRMMMTTYSTYKTCKAKPPRQPSKSCKSQLFLTENLLSQHLRTLGIIFANANSLLSHSKLRDYILDSMENLDVTLSQLTEVLLQACSSQQSKLASNVVAACKLLYYSLVEACQGASYLSVLRKRELLSLLITTFLEYLEKNNLQTEATESIQRNEVLLSLLYELLLGAPHKESDSTLVRLAKTLLSLLETSISPIINRLSVRISSEIWPILNPTVFPQDVISSLFRVLGNYVLRVNNPPSLTDDRLFSVMLHVNNDEDLGFLFPVLLEWDARYQYLQGKVTEENKDEDREVDSEQFLEDWLGEQAVMDFMPEQLRSGDFPVEQYYQYILGQERGGWSRGRGARRTSARRVTGRRPPTKKPSNSPSCQTLTKLDKLLDERLKSIEETKPEDDESEKTRKTNEKLFYKRLKQVIKDSQSIAGNLSVKGAAVILEPMGRVKAMELVTLVYQVQQQLLVDSKTKIPVLPVNPYAKQPADAASTEVIKAKRLVHSSLIDSQVIQKLEYVLESGSTLSAQRVMDRLSTDITGAYSHPLLSRNVQAGAAFSICINQIIRLVKNLLRAERWSGYIKTAVREAIEGINDWESMSTDRQMQVLGALVTAGGWSDYVRPGSLVTVERSNAQEIAIVLQGGSVSGMKNVTLIFPNDIHATPQSLPLKEVKFASRQMDPEELSVTHDLLAAAVVSKKGSETLKFHLLKTCSALTWSEWMRQKDPGFISQFVNQLVVMSESCPIDRTATEWEETHALLWEQLIEHQDGNYSLITMPTKPEAAIDFLSGQETGDLGSEPGLTAYTLPSSSYISSLPEDRSNRRADISLKMLKYWEKCIIPRIQDFVRSSFKPYEMDYFFEQLRQPLRIGDQAKAIEIAMVLCDNKLPSGVILPDMNHDWSAVTIDECVVGSWVVTRLKSKSLAHLESSLLRRYQWQGVSEVPAIIRVVDLRANLVLIEIVDVEQLEMTQLWVPVSSLYFPDHTPPLPSNSHQYPLLLKRYTKCSQAVSSIYARKSLLQCLNQACISTLTPYLSVVDVAKWLVWDELTDDAIEGWLNSRHDYFFPCTYKPPETFSVTNYIHEPQSRYSNERNLAWLESQLILLQSQDHDQERDSLLDWTVSAWHELGDQIAAQKRSIDIAELAKLISGPVQNVQITPQSIVSESGNDKKCFPLHFGSDQNCGVVVSFQNTAFLCGNSKLQFFADAAGEELLLELKAGKTGRGTLAPVVFRKGQVWCAYSTFLDATCSVYNQAQEGTTTLACEVCLIPWNWTALTWLTESLTAVIARKPSLEGIKQIHSLNYAITYVLNTAKAPAPIRQQLFRLMTRVMRRLRYIHCETRSGMSHFEGMGVQESWLESLIDEVKTLRDNEFKGSDTLFSSYLQDAVEFLATTLLPWDYFAVSETPKMSVPEWVEAMIKTLGFLNYFRSEGPLREDVKTVMTKMLEHDQWKHVYLVRNIGKPIETVQSTIATLAGSNKIRIVDLDSDVVTVEEHTAVVIIDGLSLAYYQETDFEEEEKKEEQAEEVKEPEMWECSACTLQNPNALNECEACGAPRVIRPSEPPKQVDVPHTNVAEIQEKLNENAENAIKEFLTAVETALSTEEMKCEVTKMKDEDAEIVGKALKMRLLDGENRLKPLVSSKIDQIAEFSTLFPSSPDSNSKEKFSQSLQSNSFLTMKQLESLGLDLWLEPAFGLSQSQLSLKQLEQLTLAVECEMCQETRAVLYISPSFLRFTDSSRLSSNIAKSVNISDVLVTQYQELIGIPLRELRYHWALIKLFNYNLSEAIGLLNLKQHQLLPRGTLTLSTSSAISEMRGLIMLPIKVEMQQKVFEKTSIHRENPPKVILERLKLQKDTKKDSVFLKAYEQMKDISPALLRVPKPRGADPFIAFQVVFKGELVVGEAGPYRQFFADISKDLQGERVLGLFCPSVNNRERLGTGRDRFVIVPSTTSAQQLSLFEYLGMLMGCCVRTGTRLILDLPSFIWKPLVGQNLRLEDLQSIDYPICEMLKLVESASPDLFEESFENFSARLSDETIVDLKPNGRFIPVTYENKSEFISKLLQCRFQESQKQCEAMRRGLSRLVPSGLLNLVTWKQLESWVCGKHSVDLELLKRHTRLSGGLEENSPRVLWFWEILGELSQEERLRFIKFSWGQERLPGNDEEFERTNTRLMLKPSMMEGNVDGRLPKADTCFFNLELPNYSSKEVMKRQLRFALTADCDSMNADEPVSEQPDSQLRGGEHYSEDEDNME